MTRTVQITANAGTARAAQAAVEDHARRTGIEVAGSTVAVAPVQKFDHEVAVVVASKRPATTFVVALVIVR